MMTKRSIHPRNDARSKSKNLSENWKKRTRGSVVWRCLKGIVFIFCLTFFFYQSASFLMVYYKYPTTTKIEFTYPDEFEAPALTFCSGNPLKRSKFCEEYPKLCGIPINIMNFCEKYTFLCKDGSYPVILRHNPTYPNPTSAIYEIFNKGNVTKEFWEEWSWSMRNNDRNKLKTVFVLGKGKFYYPCYSDNLLLNSSDEPLKINISKTDDLKSIFQYELRIQRSEELVYWKRPKAFLSIHSPFEPVNPHRQGEQLKLGHKYNIYIRLEEQRQLDHPYETNCTNYTDLWIKRNHQGPRSQRMCKELCWHDLFKSNQHTTPEFQMLEYPIRVCQSNCEDSLEERTVLERCRKDCKADCRDNIVVEVFLADRQIVVEKHVPVYDVGFLFSYVGGLMGCWLGVSIWAFAGIAEKGFRRSLQWVEKIKNYFKETSPARNATF